MHSFAGEGRKPASTLLVVLALLASLGGSLRAAEPTANPLYLDPAQPAEKRAQDLVARLTLEEKAMLLNHKGSTVERFGIRCDRWNQCLQGVWWDQTTTLFPVPLALAATWDSNLVHEVATAISDEARAIYNGWHQDPAFPGEHKGLIYRAPVINIERNPYWGRNEEAYGEDPYLTGRIGVAFVKGLQGNDPKYLKLVSTLKHYAVNNVEQGRTSLSATVPERMLYEYWLPHFRDCIVEGHAQSVMASYNAINGVPSNINALLLTDILKQRWGFQGFVVSDLGGVNTMVTGHMKSQMSYEEAVAKSLIAGCDFSDKEFEVHLPTAVRQGLLPEARLNDAVFRVLRDRIRLGEFDRQELVPYSKIPTNVICSPEHRALALKAAQESIALLINRNNFLPLNKSKLKTIAVIGPHADTFTPGGYSGKPENPVKPLQGIRNRAENGTKVLYARGCEISGGSSEDDSIAQAAAIARGADVAIVYVGTNNKIESEGRDRTSLSLPGRQEDLVKAVCAANQNTVVVLMNAGPLTVPWLKENVPAILEAWWAGVEGGDAIADVLFGDANPAGRLLHTVYASESQVPPQDEYDVTKGFTYMYLNGKPLFPFGHGLSYTRFKYSDLRVSPKQIPVTGQVMVRVDVENTGKRAGDEVVQLYVHEVECSVKRPSKELRGFERVALRPGQKKTIAFTLAGEKLSFWDVKTHGFVVEPGAFDVLVGSSSQDIRVQTRIGVKRE
jgi:beta-glucosidase